MNRHLWGLWLLILAVGFGHSFAIGQQAPTIPQAAITAANVQPYLDQIRQYVTYHAQRLAGDDAAAQSAAREALVNAALPQGSSEPGPAYLDAYARQLDEALLAIPNSASIRVRLNAAIVIARVAEAANNYRLADSAIRYMNDDSVPVALWAVKASEYILPHELNNPLMQANPKVLKAIQKAAAEKPAGPLIDAAYEALRLRILDGVDALTPAAVQAVLPVIHEIVDARIQRMISQAIELPEAEARAAFFLTNPRVWPGLNDQQKLRSVQLINNLIHIAVQRINANPEETVALVPLLQEIGKSLQVVGQNEGNTAISNAARDIAQIGDNTPVQQMIERSQAMQRALQATPAFSQLQPPPQLEPTSGGQAGSSGVVAGRLPQQ